MLGWLLFIVFVFIFCLRSRYRVSGFGCGGPRSPRRKCWGWLGGIMQMADDVDDDYDDDDGCAFSTQLTIDFVDRFSTVPVTSKTDPCTSTELWNHAILHWICFSLLELLPVYGICFCLWSLFYPDPLIAFSINHRAVSSLFVSSLLILGCRLNWTGCTFLVFVFYLAHQDWSRDGRDDRMRNSESTQKKIVVSFWLRSSTFHKPPLCGDFMNEWRRIPTTRIQNHNYVNFEAG